MPMFESDAEFEAYVAQQQAELAGPEDQTPAPKQKSAMERSFGVLSLVIPLIMVVLAGYFFYVKGPSVKGYRNDPWDTILGTTAWLGGREYNKDADTLTDRLTFDKPLKKDKD